MLSELAKTALWIGIPTVAVVGGAAAVAASKPAPVPTPPVPPATPPSTSTTPSTPETIMTGHRYLVAIVYSSPAPLAFTTAQVQAAFPGSVVSPTTSPQPPPPATANILSAQTLPNSGATGPAMTASYIIDIFLAGTTFATAGELAAPVTGDPTGQTFAIVGGGAVTSVQVTDQGPFPTYGTGAPTTWSPATTISPGQSVRVSVPAAAFAVLAATMGLTNDATGWGNFLALPAWQQIAQPSAAGFQGWTPGQTLPGDWPPDDTGAATEYHAQWVYAGSSPLPIPTTTTGSLAGFMFWTAPLPPAPPVSATTFFAGNSYVFTVTRTPGLGGLTPAQAQEWLNSQPPAPGTTATPNALRVTNVTQSGSSPLAVGPTRIAAMCQATVSLLLRPGPNMQSVQVTTGPGLAPTTYTATLGDDNAIAIGVGQTLQVGWDATVAGSPLSADGFGSTAPTVLGPASAHDGRFVAASPGFAVIHAQGQNGAVQKMAVHVPGAAGMANLVDHAPAYMPIVAYAGTFEVAPGAGVNLTGASAPSGGVSSVVGNPDGTYTVTMNGSAGRVSISWASSDDSGRTTFDFMPLSPPGMEGPPAVMGAPGDEEGELRVFEAGKSYTFTFSLTEQGKADLRQNPTTWEGQAADYLARCGVTYLGMGWAVGKPRQLLVNGIGAQSGTFALPGLNHQNVLSVHVNAPPGSPGGPGYGGGVNPLHGGGGTLT